jgi:hypothetical protein
MRRRSLILGLLAVAATGSARAAVRKSSRRIAIVNSSLPVEKMTEASGGLLFEELFNEWGAARIIETPG